MLQKITLSITCVIMLLTFNQCSTLKEPIIVPLVFSSVLQTGELNGAGEEGFSQKILRITSLSHWNETSKKLSIVNPFESSFDINQVDFENMNLYLYTDKVRSSAGYELTISNGEMNDNNLKFIIHIKRPTGNVAEVITQPLLIFTTPKTTTEQRFSFNEL